jgi:ribosomal peptide maturation radical SAM protein 1
MSMHSPKVNSTLPVSLKGLFPPGDVLLLAPPLADIPIPFIGLHQLEAVCNQEGLKTKVLYLNFIYSTLMGYKLHNQIALDHTLLLNDRLFSSIAFGYSSIEGLVEQALNKSWVPDHCWKLEGRNGPETIPPPVISYREWVKEIDWVKLEKKITDWTLQVAEQVASLGYSIVGASTTFGGLVSAVALLKAVKQLNPTITTVLGGALCDGEMAEGVASLDACIDYIFSGEGEITFPLLVKSILAGTPPQDTIIYGQKVSHLDTIPPPNFSHYFLQKQQYFRRQGAVHSTGKSSQVISYETSRGCWVGKCTFCGLNGRKNHYRYKTPKKVIQELKELRERHLVDIIYMSDCIMPPQYFKTLLPKIAHELPGLTIKYEMKPNLTLEEISCLKSAGVTEIQPGIESLSPALLRQMRKPFTVRGNLETLRYARSVGIDLKWVLLFGFPRDDNDEYEEMLHTISLIRHLQPPFWMSPLKVCRFSKYQTVPGEFGITDLRPSNIHQDMFPSEADQNKLAFYFTGEFEAQSRQNPKFINSLWHEYLSWQESWSSYETLKLEFLRPQLHLTQSNKGQFILEDTRGRPGQQKRLEIPPEYASLLLVSQPLKDVPEKELTFIQDNGYGVVIDSWLVPLPTTEPSLLREFEKKTSRAAK